MSDSNMVLMLRGVNVGGANRVPMATLREALTAAGCVGTRTYLQSGNVVLAAAGRDAGQLRELAERILREDFSLTVSVVTRTRDELAAVVAADPYGAIAADPKRYQVVFLSEPLAPDGADWLGARLGPDEQLTALGRELYCWHPGGIHRSKLVAALASRAALGDRVATARTGLP